MVLVKSFFDIICENAGVAYPGSILKRYRFAADIFNLDCDGLTGVFPFYLLIVCRKTVLENCDPILSAHHLQALFMSGQAAAAADGTEIVGKRTAFQIGFVRVDRHGP